MIRCFITDRRLAGGIDRLLDAVERCDGEGVDFIQLREKDLGGRELAALAQECIRRCRRARVLINSRVDVALAYGAAGAHLPSQAPPPSLWRSIVPREFLFSVACHNPSEAVAAQDEGADLIVFSPVFAPLSKPGEGVGVDALREVCATVRTPVLALGGITAGRIEPCLKAGAAGVAAISLFLCRG